MSDNPSQNANQELEATLPLEVVAIASDTEVLEESLVEQASSLQLDVAAEHEAAVTGEEDELDEHSQFDDASDDFAYEAADDEMAEEDDEDIDAEDDSAPYDYDAEDDSEEMSDVIDDEEFDPPAREPGVAAADSAESSASSLDSADEDLSDGDNDPSPQPKPKRDHSKHAAQFEPQRLAKILAAAGIDARRKCEEYITAGRVTVDGQTITDLAFRADPFSQKIELDGERIKLQRKVYFVLNKPRGVVCTNFDPAGRPRIIDLFPQFKERLFTIGRLDEESEGLILVTNDGELANRMAHPRYRVPKFYLCHVKGVPSSETLAALKRGMYFEEGRFSVEGVRMKKVVGGSSYLDIVLNEGQNREIRRLLAKVDHKVMRLKRVGFGPIRLGDLPSGAFRPLTTEESKLLKDLSEQRAHLDKTASRGRAKKPRGGKPAYGSKSSFGSKPAYGKSASAYDKPAYGAKPEFPAKRSYGDKVRSRQVSAPRDDENIPVSDEGSRHSDRGPRRPVGGNAPREYSQGSGGSQRPPRDEQRPQRRLIQASENDDVIQPQGEFTGERRYGNRSPQGDDNQRSQTGDRRPPRRDHSNDEVQSSAAEGEFTPQHRANRPPQGGYNQRPQGGERRPPRREQTNTEGQSFQSQSNETGPRRYGNRPPQGGEGRPPRRYQSNEADSSYQNQSSNSDSDFNGGRRRVNDQQQEAEYTPRPQRQGRPPQQEGGYTPRPPRGQGRPPQGRPPQRRYGSQEGNTSGGYSGQRRYGSQEGNTGERSGGSSSQRRPAGNRGYGQSGPPSGPPRGRGQRPVRAPRPTTADGKEILEGKVTGYRTPPKEGLPRRPYKAVIGMKVNREQRQQRRKKSDG